MKLEHRHRLSIGGILFALMAVFFLVYGPGHFWSRSPNQPPITQEKIAAAKKAEMKARAAADAAKAKEAAEKAKALKLAELGTIRKGEGIEHAIKRQILFAPEIVDPKYRFNGTKMDAGRVATLIARDNGDHDLKFGREKRVKTPGVVYLVVNGKVGNNKIQEYASEGTSPRPLHILTASASGSQDFGAPGHENLQSYEYLYTGEG